MSAPAEAWPEVMVTAHRKLPTGCVDEWLGAALRERLVKLRDDYGLQRATTGMATGGDQLWGVAAMELQIPLRAAVPYPSQPLDGQGEGRFGPRWTKAEQATWHRLKEYAETTGGVEYVHDHDPRSFGERVNMLHKRNDWMLANSTAVVGIWAPANVRSGTGSCLRKAVGAGKPIVLFDLAARTVTRPRPEDWARRLNVPAPAAARQ